MRLTLSQTNTINSFATEPIALGQINFINCLPINLPLKLRGNEGFKVYESFPSDLNLKLRSGKLDLAPISSYEFLSHRENYGQLNIGISSKEKALSVLLFVKDPADLINPQEIYLTNKSATSVNLLKIILQEVYKLDLTKIKFIEFTDNSPDYSIKLLIGDEALKEPSKNYQQIIDLGEEWYKLTGLPMVFAIWAYNNSSALAQSSKQISEIELLFKTFISRAFDELYPEMIIEAYKQTGLSKQKLIEYFNHLDYNLEQKHLLSLDLFAKYISALNKK